MYLGDVIKKYRDINKISLREFAKRANLSHTYISALEKNIDSRTGKPIAPTLDSVRSCAYAMNMEIDDLLHMLDDDQLFDLKNVAPQFNDPSLSNVRMASYAGIDIDGLSDDEIEEIKEFVEYVRSKRKKKK